MKVSGFTFLRHAVMNGYPFEESIRSLLPLVDEFVIAVGDGQDDTLARVEAIGDAKIRIIPTQWNEAMQDRGFVYGQQKMIAQYNCSGDWAFYLEADEVLHENELESIEMSWNKTYSIEMTCHQCKVNVQCVQTKLAQQWLSACSIKNYFSNKK